MYNRVKLDEHVKETLPNILSSLKDGSMLAEDGAETVISAFLEK